MAGVNKVIGKNGEVIIDISNDTVSAALLAEGATAHAANGDIVTGTGKDLSIIDDTAGSGDIGYVWSANKSYTEITDLKSALSLNSNLSIATDKEINILDYSGSENNYFIDSSGNKRYRVGLHTTKLIKIPSGTTEVTLKVHVEGNGQNTLVTYWDANKTFIGYKTVTEQAQETIALLPENTSYINISYYNPVWEILLPVSSIIDLNSVINNGLRNKIISTMKHTYYNSNYDEVYSSKYLFSDFFTVDDYYVCSVINSNTLIINAYVYESQDQQPIGTISTFSDTKQICLTPNRIYRLIIRSTNSIIKHNELSDLEISYGWFYCSNIVDNPTTLLSLYKSSYVLIPARTLYNSFTDLPENCNSNAKILINRKYKFSNLADYIEQEIVELNSNGLIGNFYYRLIRSSGTIINNWHNDVSPISIMKNKKISIYGDSISTYSGWIPEGNAVYYPHTNTDPNPVDNVNKTWWKRTIDALHLELVVNNSWSGRDVISKSSATLARDGYKEANVLQLKKQVDGVDVIPDIIIVRMGSNDFKDAANPLGTYDGTSVLPTVDPPTTFLDAYAVMLHRIMTNFPLAEVYCCTIPPMEWNYSTIGFPEVNTRGESLAEWNNAIKKLASAFGAKIIDHAACGMTYYNMPNYFQDLNESTGTMLHPNALGHALMANITIQTLDNAVRIRY